MTKPRSEATAPLDVLARLGRRQALIAIHDNCPAYQPYTHLGRAESIELLRGGWAEEYQNPHLSGGIESMTVKKIRLTLKGWYLIGGSDQMEAMVRLES